VCGKVVDLFQSPASSRKKGHLREKHVFIKKEEPKIGNMRKGKHCSGKWHGPRLLKPGRAKKSRSDYEKRGGKRKGLPGGGGGPVVVLKTVKQ